MSHTITELHAEVFQSDLKEKTMDFFDTLCRKKCFKDMTIYKDDYERRVFYTKTLKYGSEEIAIQKKKNTETPSYYIMRTRTSNETKRTVVIKERCVIVPCNKEQFKIYEEMDRNTKITHRDFLECINNNLIVMLDYRGTKRVIKYDIKA
jgi:hypothetical protein